MVCQALSCVWFCLKALQIYVQFIEGTANSDTNSDNEGVDSVEDLNEANIEDGDFSHLLERVIFWLTFVVIEETQAMSFMFWGLLLYLYKMKPCFKLLINQDDGCENKGIEESCEAGESNASDKEDASDEVCHLSMLHWCCFLPLCLIFYSKKN